MTKPLYKCYLDSPYKSLKHSTYFDAYEHFFSEYRGKEITFIEIGILNGGSLFMWRDYFGPQARIIGVDFNPSANKWKDHGFEIYIGNQADGDFWKKFVDDIGSIDIVLDDGGHTYDQQIITTESLMPHINDGGILVVEDTHTSYMNGFGPQKYSFINYVKLKIDHINYRFSLLIDKHIAESRFWSIEIMESMVAFKVNTKATDVVSMPCENNGEDSSAKDFRNSENVPYEMLLSVAYRLSFLKALPGAKRLFLIAENIFVRYGFKSKKYFK